MDDIGEWRDYPPHAKPAGPYQLRRGGAAGLAGVGAGMDQTYLIVLAFAVVIAVASVGMIRRRTEAAARWGASEATFAVSTEGMKVCPSCGMGNLWMERSCSACRGALKG